MWYTAMFLCYGSQIIDKFIAQVGMNSAEGDKRHQGDKRTPRGEYYVCLKNGNSRYYRALGLSYPNEKDAERGYEAGLISQAKRDEIIRTINQGGMPDWSTALGGYIEIHGEKGGPTDGCIAVGNPLQWTASGRLWNLDVRYKFIENSYFSLRICCTALHSITGTFFCMEEEVCFVLLAILMILKRRLPMANMRQIPAAPMAIVRLFSTPEKK